MPYRSTALVWAVFGSVLVLGLILLGRDLRRAARTGPGWKRKLVAAGLVLLGALGLTTGNGGCEGPGGNGSYSITNANDPIPPEMALSETSQWIQIATTWQQAEEIASGKRGQYPFDEKGKKSVLDRLATAGANLDRLQAAGLLNEPETGLLKKELALLASRVNAMRPTEMRMATCYEPMAFTPARDSLARLADRLPLLEKLAASESVHPQVLAKVLETVEKDIAVLQQQKMLDALPEDQRAEAEKTAQQAQSQVEKIRNLVKQQVGTLETSKAWAKVTDAWKAAVPLAVSGSSTTAQREAIDAKFETAEQSIMQLIELRLLTRPEADLLYSEAARLQGQIRRNPPTDSKVTCYDMAYMPPARQSMERLTKRLPLLREVAAGGKVHPAALEKVLGSIEEDIQTVSDAESIEQLGAEEKARAEKLHADAGSAVAEIKKLLEESP